MPRLIHKMSSSTSLLGALALAFALASAAAGAAACASAKSAEEHREVALTEEEKAAQHLSRYDPNARAVALTTSPDGEFMEAQHYNPTHFEKLAADAHTRTAERHRAAAHALEASEEAACKSSPPATRSACPLLLPIVVKDIPRGVQVTFEDAAAGGRAADLVRCQQAFAVTRNFEDLPSCALYGRNLKVAHNGATLELTASDDAGVARLRANVRGHHPSSN